MCMVETLAQLRIGPAAAEWVMLGALVVFYAAQAVRVHGARRRAYAAR